MNRKKSELKEDASRRIERRYHREASYASSLRSGNRGIASCLDSNHATAIEQFVAIRFSGGKETARKTIQLNFVDVGRPHRYEYDLISTIADAIFCTRSRLLLRLFRVSCTRTVSIRSDPSPSIRLDSLRVLARVDHFIRARSSIVQRFSRPEAEVK